MVNKPTPQQSQAPENGKPREKTHDKSDANLLLGAGIGISAYGTALAATTGVVCPACIVVAPALIGGGVYKRMKLKESDSPWAE